VLDEATSALDVATERKIMNMIEELSGSMTIIMVSHKESVQKLIPRKIHL